MLKTLIIRQAEVTVVTFDPIIALLPGLPLGQLLSVIVNTRSMCGEDA